jgi:transcriptional regulator with XRE-family HTH domain
MDNSARGQRLARARRRRGLSQAALAGLAGRSESWLSQVERGLRRIDSHSVLMSLAQILRVDVAELTGEDSADPQASQYTAAKDIERAMMTYDALESVIGADSPEDAADFARLQLGVERVNRAYQAARYDEAGRMLPALIQRIEATARTCPRQDATAAEAIRAQVYQATAMVLSRVGETGLAWTAADRAVTAAEHAGAGLLAAVSAFRLAHVFTRRKHTAQARDLVTSAASALQRSGTHRDPERMSVLGGLHLAGALAAAAEFDRAAANRSLAAAQRVAEGLGADRNDHWTAFGPTNVRITRSRRLWHSVTQLWPLKPARRSTCSTFRLGWPAAAARSAWISLAATPSSATTRRPSTCSLTRNAPPRSSSATTPPPAMCSP